MPFPRILLFLIGVLALSARAHESVSGRIRSLPVEIRFCSLIQDPLDAILVPQFAGYASFGGLGEVLANSGGADGLNAYNAHIAEFGEQKFGNAVPTKSGLPHIPFYLHVVTVGSYNDFETVSIAVYRALQKAEMLGLKRIGIPALATGNAGSLSGLQSAHAIMSAVDQFVTGGGRLEEIIFFPFPKREHYDGFVHVLREKIYTEVPKSTVGEKVFDLAEWVIGMHGMDRATQAHMDEKLAEAALAATRPADDIILGDPADDIILGDPADSVNKVERPPPALGQDRCSWLASVLPSIFGKKK